MGIFDGAGIHGTDETSARSGTAASHGCIRMAIPDVEELYDRVAVGNADLHRLSGRCQSGAAAAVAVARSQPESGVARIAGPGTQPAAARAAPRADELDARCPEWRRGACERLRTGRR